MTAVGSPAIARARASYSVRASIAPSSKDGAHLRSGLAVAVVDPGVRHERHKPLGRRRADRALRQVAEHEMLPRQRLCRGLE